MTIDFVHDDNNIVEICQLKCKSMLWVPELSNNVYIFMLIFNNFIFFHRNSSHCQLPYWILLKGLTCIAEELLQTTLHNDRNARQKLLPTV